jgi:hypothetical protein
LEFYGSFIVESKSVGLRTSRYTGLLLTFPRQGSETGSVSSADAPGENAAPVDNIETTATNARRRVFVAPFIP